MECAQSLCLYNENGECIGHYEGEDAGTVECLQKNHAEIRKSMKFIMPYMMKKRKKKGKG